MDARVVAQLRALAAEDDVEVCGALIGDGSIVVEAWPLPNQSSHARDSFFIPARSVLRAEQLAEARGLQLMGFYHSHPHGDAVPSESDVTLALPGYLYLIVPSEGAVRAWRLRDDRSAFVEVS